MIKTMFSETILKFEGKEYFVSGDVEFEMGKEDWGRGTYEYWGHRETNKDVVWAPQGSAVTNLTITDGESEITDPSKELIKASEDVLIANVEEDAVETYEE